MKTYLLLEVEHERPIADLATKAEQRAYNIDGVRNTACLALSAPVSYQMAKSQMEAAAERLGFEPFAYTERS